MFASYGAIAVHYPNEEDARTAAADGRITPAVQRKISAALRQGTKPPQQTPIGGEILIHGGGSSSDWTLGCAAMDNDALDTLREKLPRKMKTQILILP